MARFGVYPLIILAFALRVFRLDYQSIWWDESFSISLASTSLGHITQTTAGDIHPPLYYYLLHYWMLLTGQGEFAVRFLSAIAGVLIVALVWRLGTTLFGLRLGLFGGFLAAISPFFVAYSQETRMYIVLAVFGLASAYALWLLLDGKWRSPLLWAGYVASTALAFYTSYFAVEVLFFENIFVAGWMVQKWKADVRSFLARWLLSQGFVALVCAPWALIGLGQFSDYGFGKPTAPTFGALLAEMWHVIALGTMVESSWHWPIAYGIGAFIIAGILLYLRRKPFPRELAYLLCYLAAPLLGFVLTLQFRPSYHPRYFLVALPPYFLLGAVSVAGLRRLSKPAAALVGLALVAISLVILSGYYFLPEFAKDDARSTVSFIEQEATADDLVLWITPYPFQYYYHGKAQAQELVVNPETTAGELTRLAQGKKRVFWATWRWAPLDPWQLMPFLLERFGAKLGERSFPGYDVFWYQAPPSGDYSQPNLSEKLMNFEDKVLLTGANVQSKLGAARSGEPVFVSLSWRSLTPMDEDLKVYVHVKDAKGRIVGQADNRLYNEKGITTSYWSVGDSGFDYLAPLISPGTPPGQYTIEVGVYAEKSGRRLQIAGTGNPNVIGSLRVDRGMPPLADSLSIPNRLDKDFGDLSLLGYSASEGATTKVAQGASFPVTLFWKAQRKPSSDHKVVLALRDDKGTVQARQVANPVDDAYATSTWESGELVNDAHDFLVPAITAPGSYQLEVGLDDSSPVVLFKVNVVERPRSFEVPSITHPLSTKVGQNIELLGYDIGTQKAGQVKAGEDISLILYWRAIGSPEKSFTVFTHLLDRENHVVSQHDGIPQEGNSATTGWLKGEVVVDRHTLKIGKDVPPGRYTLEAGMYDALNGERAFIDGQENRVVLGEIEVVGHDNSD